MILNMSIITELEKNSNMRVECVTKPAAGARRGAKAAPGNPEGLPYLVSNPTANKKVYVTFSCSYAEYECLKYFAKVSNLRIRDYIRLLVCYPK